MYIFVFWTGTNQLTKNRKRCLLKLIKKTGVKIKLITPNNLHKYILKDFPLHPAYQYLSLVHKADYLRTYFMHHYGGGYSDIKEPTGNWIQSFYKLRYSNYWIIGYRESKYGVGVHELQDKWQDLIGNGAYICKPKTPFTTEWYNELHKILDNKLEQLQLHPAKESRDWKGKNGSKYPLEWNEILGRIFHKLCYKYKDKIINTLPHPYYGNYQ